MLYTQDLGLYMMVMLAADPQLSNLTGMFQLHLVLVVVSYFR